MRLLATLCWAFVVLVPSRSGAAVILGPFTGSTDGSDPTMANRLLRDGLISDCSGKTFPGTVLSTVACETFCSTTRVRRSRHGVGDGRRG